MAAPSPLLTMFCTYPASIMSTSLLSGFVLLAVSSVSDLAIFDFREVWDAAVAIASETAVAALESQSVTPLPAELTGAEGGTARFWPAPGALLPLASLARISAAEENEEAEELGPTAGCMSA